MLSKNRTSSKKQKKAVKGTITTIVSPTAASASAPVASSTGASAPTQGASAGVSTPRAG